MRQRRSEKAKVKRQTEEVKPASQRRVRAKTMDAFEKSVERNRELLKKLAVKCKPSVS